jgi:glycosyltransferase involved in cell wall biosynthesis
MERKLLQISVFSTNGTGIKTWEQVGSLKREVAIYKKFAEHGWNVVFYTYDRTSAIPDVGFSAKIQVQWPFLLPERLNWAYQLFLPVLRFVSGRKSSLIITNQAHGGWPAVIAGRLWNAKVIARCGMVHGECSEILGKTGSRAQKKAKVEKWTFKHADKCVVPTKELAEWVTDNYKIDPSKINVIPNYVDTELFKPSGKAEKDFDILCVGRLVPKKRHRLLLESLRGSNLKIHFVGGGKLADEFNNIAAKSSIELKITQRVEHNQLPAFFNNAKMYVNLAKWEGHPKAMIEAMACGCTCIGARSPGIENLIIDGKTGILIEPEPEKVCETINKLLADSKLRAKLGNNARDFANEYFSLDKIFRQYMKVFEDTLAQ